MAANHNHHRSAPRRPKAPRTAPRPTVIRNTKGQYQGSRSNRSLSERFASLRKGWRRMPEGAKLASGVLAGGLALSQISMRAFAALAIGAALVGLVIGGVRLSRSNAEQISHQIKQAAVQPATQRPTPLGGLGRAQWVPVGFGQLKAYASWQRAHGHLSVLKTKSGRVVMGCDPASGLVLGRTDADGLARERSGLQCASAPAGVKAVVAQAADCPAGAEAIALGSNGASDIRCSVAGHWEKADGVAFAQVDTTGAPVGPTV